MPVRNHLEGLLAFLDTFGERGLGSVQERGDVALSDASTGGHG
jgi:hypothetical protein